ncbi:hypothetical protein BH10PSE6_BH10PSE6_08490 [soil metagenome]
MFAASVARFRECAVRCWGTVSIGWEPFRMCLRHQLCGAPWVALRKATRRKKSRSSSPSLVWLARKLPRLVGAVLAAGLLMATPVAGQTVVDGDTIKLDGGTYRIGASTPPRRGRLGGRQRSEHSLARVGKGRTVTCEPKARDRFGRPVALYRADGADLGAAMVSAAGQSYFGLFMAVTHGGASLLCPVLDVVSYWPLRSDAAA